MEATLLLIALTIFFKILLIIVRHYQNKYFYESKGIPYFGDGTLSQIYSSLRGIDPLTSAAQSQYFRLKSTPHRIALTKDFGKLSFLVGNLPLLKQILVKDFSNFEDRRKFPLPKHETIFKKSLFSCSNEDGTWKSLRNQLSPVFTTEKLRSLFPIFEESAGKFVNYLDSSLLNQSCHSSGKIDFCQAYSKYAMSSIISAVCAIDLKAFDGEEHSRFEEMGKKFQVFDFVKMVVLMMTPDLAGILKLSYFEKDAQEFFTKAIETSMQDYSKNTDKSRRDIIKIMLEQREKSQNRQQCSNKVSSKLMDDDTIVANCFLFILAGLDTTKSVLTFFTYAVALCQDVQDKLRTEVQETMDKNGGQLSYDAIGGMTYLDMVIKESLRMYPTNPSIDRDCTLDYRVPLPGIDLIIRKNQGIVIPVYGIHHDFEYFPEPYKFCPERFSPENKSSIDPYTWLGFGIGGRNCIGKRFALLQVKVVIALLIQNFKVSPSCRTLVPMQFENSTILRPKGDRMWLAVTRIKH